MMGRQFSSAAIWGAGGMFGRDAYKTVKREWLALLLLAILLLPGWAGYDMARGHPRRGWFGGIFLTFLLNLILAPIPTLLITALLSTPEHAGVGGAAATFSAIVFLIGIIVGLIRRRGRLRRAAVEEANGRFFIEHGFDYDQAEDLLIDRDGNKLRAKGLHDGELVYLVVGRRNKRA